MSQLLAVLALAVSDRVRDAAVSASRQDGAGPAALVHLHAYPGGSVIDLQHVVRLTQTGAVRLVERLVDAGLVERRAGRDRRTHALWLTASGSEAVGQILVERAAAVAPVLQDLAPADAATLERLLERLVAGLADDRPGALTVCRLCDRESCCSGPGCPLAHTGARP